MNSRSPYYQFDERNRQTAGSLQSPRESTSKQTYITKNNTNVKMKADKELAMGDRGRTRTRSRSSPSHDQSPDMDKNSDSYYSDDYENTTYGSDRSPTPSSKSRSPQTKKLSQKQRSTTPLHNQGLRKIGSKFPSSKRGTQWGFRSRSLNKESSPKDVDLVTKRVLSARLLKINELRNELSEHQIKLEELQKENKILKRLQFRQEKALNKFEDTENEISILISRHNNEIRTLRERLRKSQERERNTEKKLKDTEDELYRTNVSLKKLKQLSENKHLGEREELTRKLETIEIKMEERERKVKDLEKNIELTQSSYQRQLLSEKKKAHEAQEECKLLREELNRLTQKLKDKERELDAKNIYAYRLSKPSPKKDTEITPRRKVTNQSLSTKSVQTTESTSYVEFSPLPPPPPLELASEVDWKTEETFASMEQDYREKQLRQEADKLKKEKEREDRRKEQEEKQRREREQMALEDKAKKLRDEWEKEESEREIKEKLLYEDILAKEENKNNTEEEKLKKELLLAKMLEIDKEKHEVFYSDSSNPTVQSPLLDSSLKPDSAEKKHKTYKFSEPTEKLFNGLPVHDASSKTEVAARRNPKHVGSTDDFTFGSYAPSFGKGRSSSQKSEVLEEPVIISNSKLNIQKDKRSNLMEQLFGSSSNTTLPSIPNTSDSGGLFSGDTKKDHESKNILPWEKNSRGSLKKDLFFDDGRNANSNKHHSQHTPGKPVVRALDSLEDDIEEVVL